MRHRKTVFATMLGISLVAASCGSDENSSSATPSTAVTTPTTASTTAVSTTGAPGETTGAPIADAPGAFAAAAYTTPLADACPNPLVVQKDWLAEVEHNVLYQLIGGGGEATQNTYTGPLGSTGIDLTILDGGPGLGDGATPSTALYAGNLVQGITPDLAFVYTDDAVLLSDKFPTVAVMAPFELNPQGLMYDPATYGEIASVEDVIAAVDEGARIYVTSKQFSYVRYLIGKGVPSDAFIEGYAGDKDKFVTSGGTWLNQGYASSEPYTFSEETPEWDKPVDFVTVSELGLGIYPITIAVAENKLEDMSECLTGLVPLMQQAVVDYIAAPDEVNSLIESINAQDLGAAFWKTSIGLNDAATEIFTSEGLISNGDDDMLGDFDEARVQSVIDVLLPIFEADNSSTLDPDVTAADLFTNRFLDPTIGLP